MGAGSPSKESPGCPEIRKPADAIAAYAARYRPPKDRGDERRVVVIEATRILANAHLGTAGPPGARD